MKKLIIVPAYNEAANLKELVTNIKKSCPDYDYIVINDGSNDTTKELCTREKYNVLHLPTNSGIGVAVQTGYKYALAYNYDIAVQIDGDGQHDVQYINQVVKPIIEGDANIAIGSRFIDFKGFQSSITRRIGIRVLSLIIWLCTGVKVRDVTSGFRAVDRKFISIFAEDYSKDYPEPEAIITTRIYDGKIVEVPVVMKERINGTSSINLKKSVYYMIKVTLAICVRRLGYGIRRSKGE